MADRATQLGLFGGGTEPTTRMRVRPAVAEGDRALLARRLPSLLRLGTSSWSFPGWADIIYEGRHSETTLARHGLAAYASHPLLATVGLDRTHYAPIEAEAFARYRAAVGEDFRFLVKAHDECSLARFPDHPRYGDRRGTVNPRFLDPGYASEAVIGPMLEGLRETAGAVVFQFARQPTRWLDEPVRLADRLYRFLDELPPGPAYGVELRNPELLSPAYGAALAAAEAFHCFNAHPTMPGIVSQRERLGPSSKLGPAVVVRWLLGAGMRYDEARDLYAPFDRLAAPDSDTRRAIMNLSLEAMRAAIPTYVIVNNKAEGSSPLSVIRLAEGLPEHLDPAG